MYTYKYFRDTLFILNLIIMPRLTKTQLAAKVADAKELIISMTKSAGIVMLPANSVFDVSIKDGVTVDSIEAAAIITESGTHKFVPVTCEDSDGKIYESSLYCGTTEKTPENRRDWHIGLFEEFSDVIGEISFVGKTGEIRKNKAGYDVTYLSLEE